MWTTVRQAPARSRLRTAAAPLLCALTLLPLLLTGCQADGPEAAMAEYVERLARTLEVAAPAVDIPPMPLPPRPGRLRVKLPGSSLDTLDFLALTGCELQVTIGKRNSSLGRMAAPSQRLLLELEFLRVAPPCIAHQRESGRTGLADTLEAAWRAKREQLPALIFNATLAGDEYRQFWRAGIAPGAYPAATGGQVIDALQAINGLARRWLAGDYRADNLAFEIYLGEVVTGDGGSLLQALAVQAGWLAAADAALASRDQRGPLCAPGIRYEAADILPNVVRRFFVSEVQPHSAALGGRYHQLLPAVRELEAMLADALPPPFTAWQAQRDHLLEALAAAPRRHVAKLQSTMAPCGGITAQG
jgi:hypothetical protein